MPVPKTIKIEHKANNRLEPAGQFRQKIRAGSEVIFGLVPPLAGLVVSFRGRSPFATKTVSYGEFHTLKARHDPNNPSKNIYKFDCADPKSPDSAPSLNGGEIEIIP